MTGTPPLYLLPVGHDQGADLTGPGQQPRFQVRVGSTIEELDDVRFATWLLAHDAEHGLPDRERLATTAEQLGIERSRAAAAVDALLAGGLLAEVGDAESLRNFAERHQLLPLMVGLGPDDTDPDLRVVGLLEIPVVQVSTAMYELWMSAQLEPNLWVACVRAADGARDAGRVDPYETEPEQVLTGLLAAVHPLLASRAAFLDTAPDEGQAAA